MQKLVKWVVALSIMSATFTLSAKDFAIYDMMDYVGKPQDLTADKISRAMLIYESELVKPDPTGKRKHGVLNLEKVIELARRSHREGYTVISTDIESWFGNKGGQLLSPEELKRDFELMFNIFKNENPNAIISNYGLPTETLSVIRFYRGDVPYQVSLDKWKEFNKRRNKSGVIADYANPVLYIVNPDIATWEKDVIHTVQEIKKRYPNKKIIGYIWPQYYSAKKSGYFKQFIDPKTWREMLEITYKYTDGVMIWSDKRDENDKIVRWEDPRVQAIMAETKAFIRAHDKDIKVEGKKKK
ncbi:hypothetical protein ACTUM7_04745 [Basfia succiniciproducens]|uniref:Uncharacterized protein n=1 Tax=Mannheimia succiniciproducens (strain KCTC 0769BP / MBEL55E) TaxID=221988 RepID=Q65SG9_MANSM|nr:hypothetical protein [[Mannheimia] succiniciproducens]AAU38091.1 unknown [[Mannheimia] succiniciproducens MBEL55E]